MVKTRYVLTANADSHYCPMSNNPCQGQTCMLWIDATGTRINMGYCGLLGGEAKQSRVRAAITRMLIWAS